MDWSFLITMLLPLLEKLLEWLLGVQRAGKPLTATQKARLAKVQSLCRKFITASETMGVPDARRKK